MKKTIIVEIAIMVTLTIAIIFAVEYWKYVSNLIDALTRFKEQYNSTNYFSYYPDLNYYNSAIKHNVIYGILALLAALATLTAMIIIAIKDFPCFKPLVDKLQAKRAARKQAHAEQEQIRKQERIAELQSELDALKKDE